MNGEKRLSYRSPADNNWINFAENWLCFDALVADWWSPAFFAYLSFVFYLLLADLSMVPFWAPLIKQLFNKRRTAAPQPVQGFTTLARWECRDEYQWRLSLTHTHTHTVVFKGFVVLICSWLCLSLWSNSNFYTSSVRMWNDILTRSVHKHDTFNGTKCFLSFGKCYYF